MCVVISNENERKIKYNLSLLSYVKMGILQRTKIDKLYVDNSETLSQRQKYEIFHKSFVHGCHGYSERKYPASEN